MYNRGEGLAQSTGNGGSSAHVKLRLRTLNPNVHTWRWLA